MKPILVNFGGPWTGKGWHVLRQFGIYYGHLVHFFPRFGKLYEEKSGNPAPHWLRKQDVMHYPQPI
jgi:hypothetical protein